MSIEKSETAIFCRGQKIKFLGDNLIAFQDYAWGDGEIFAEYQCLPGVEAGCYQETDQWNGLISLLMSLPESILTLVMTDNRSWLAMMY